MHKTYYELPVADFLQLLLNYAHEHKTGSIFFISNSSEWGKIVFNQGLIQAVRFKNTTGILALPSIQALSTITYHFRPDELGRSTLARDEDIDNETFFGYFGIALEKSQQVAKDEALDNTVVVTAYKPISSQQSKNAKILIADDSSTARKAISRILTEAGYRVVEARDGFETLGQLQNEQPDMLLLDLIMPGIDGYTVIKTINRMQGAPKIPIVVLTSRDSLLDKLKGMALSCDAYLTKPVQSNTLLEITDKYLRPHVTASA